jgi:hypothetical protein
MDLKHCLLAFLSGGALGLLSAGIFALVILFFLVVGG